MEYIVAVIVSLTLISILFFSLRSTVKRIDINTKKYFIDKLQDYDYLIEEKQKVLNKLNEEIEKNKEILSKKTKVDTNVNYNDKKEYYGEIVTPKYRDENLFEKYKNIKEKFSFNKADIILDFVNKIEDDGNEEFIVLSGIRKKLDSKTIYKIMKLQKKEQKEYIYSILDNNEIDILNKNIKLDDVKVNNFIIQLDTLLEKNDPTVYVYTGEKNISYDYISSMVKTEYDETINEGIKINYKGNLYDYSL